MSSDKVKQFNEILGSFLIQISSLVGSSYHVYFEQLIKYNSHQPIEYFLVYVLPLRDQILTRDEAFFYDEKVSEKKFGEDKNRMEEIFKLRNVYSALDIESQNNVWEIFQCLLVLGEEFIIINKHKYKGIN
jgi:hypothetical protein